MPKNVLQDVTPPHKRTIRDIPVPLRKKKNENDGLNNFSGPIEGIRSSKRKGSSKLKWWLSIIVVLAVVFVAFSTVFSGATIALVPKQEKVDFTANLTSIRGDVKTDIEGVPFTLMTIESVGTRTTSDVEERDVDKKASGEITVFNDYNSSPQRLIKNTRFETPDGLIYRISKSVVVPGRTTKNGKTIPGSITVTVYADAPGESYNIGLVDFTVPGFKGTDRFSKFYARSKTIMAGGYSGVMKIVDNRELEKMRGDIHTDLNQELKEKAYSQIPDGFVLYDDGIFINFESQQNVDLGDSVQVAEKGIAQVVLFDKAQLGDYIAQNVISGLGNEKVEILNIEDLDFQIKNRDDVVLDENASFEFEIGGEGHFAWVFDYDKIKSDFAGQSKKNTNAILANYIGVQEAEVTISPFWKRNFPEDVDDIKVKRILELE